MPFSDQNKDLNRAPFILLSLFLFLLPTEQIFQNLRQEYSRIQRRRQLEGAFNQTEACSSSDAPSPSSSLNAPSSPPGRKIYHWPNTHINCCLWFSLQRPCLLVMHSSNGYSMALLVPVYGCFSLFEPHVCIL